MSKVVKPYEGRPTLEKLDEAIEVLCRAIMTLSEENFSKGIAWNAIRLPDKLKAFLEGNRIIGDHELQGNLEQID